jgi:PAS domain S-box-containing protein
MPQELSQLPQPKDPEDLAAAFHLSIQLTDELLKVQEELERRVGTMETELAVANRQLAEKVDELQRTTQFLNYVLSSMHSGLIAVDREERIVAFNRAAEEILKIPISEALGRPYREILKGRDEGRATGKFREGASPVPASIHQVLQEGSHHLNVEREIGCPDGTTIGVSSSISALKDTDGRVIGAVEIFKDLSEIRRLEERLERADHLAVIGQMSATVAHEIRNPLNGIEGFAGLLEREFPPDDPRRRYARNILDGVRALNKTVTDLLQFARPTRLNLRTCRLSQIFEHTLVFLREEIRSPRADGRAPRLSPHIQIETHYQPEADDLIADVDQLRGILLNLLLNAAQAMPNGGEIRVRTEAAEIPSRIRIRISDTGTGIPPDVQAKLFTPFFSTKEHGTGLGLALTKKVIESHQGAIRVESEPGRGTTFILTLPKDPRAE